MNIEKMVVDLSRDPFNPSLNFDLAEEYLRLNQTASAVSFYLRCAEYSGDASPKAYASLIRIAQCFNDQQGREYSVTNCLLQAIAYDDTRPEAYLHLSQYYERAGQWQEAYTWASIGYGWAKADPESLPANVGYAGSYALLFQMGISAWWIGRKDESLNILHALAHMDINQMYKDAVSYNLEKLNVVL
jgi:hypothetical protein